MKAPVTPPVQHASDDAPLTYAQKHRQANREAAATVAGLAATIVVWTALGFGLSGLDADLLGTPLWAIGGTIGTWVFAIALTVFLAKRVFRNFDLDDCAEAPETRDADEKKGRSPLRASHESGDSRE